MQLQKILPNSQTSMLHRVNQMVEQRVGPVGTSLKNIFTFYVKQKYFANYDGNTVC